MKRHIRFDEDGGECEEIEDRDDRPMPDLDDGSDSEDEKEEEELTDNYLTKIMLAQIKAELRVIGYEKHVEEFANGLKDDRELQANLNFVGKLLGYLYLNRNQLIDDLAEYSTFDISKLLKWFQLTCRKKPALVADYFTYLHKDLGARPSSCKKYLIFLNTFIQ